MKKFIALSALAGLLLIGGTAFAEIGAIDNVPAATLLLPYFEVGLENSGNTTTTLFSINNASAAPTVAHVVLWTEYARATIDFDIYLTGYDVVTVNLRDLFIAGAIPRTGPNFDPGDDGISPNAPGEFSNPDNLLLPACTFPLPANIPSNLLNRIRRVHTGLSVPQGFDDSGFCGAIDQNIGSADEGVAKGYITVDAATDCSFIFPFSAGYFQDGGFGTASNNNVLWGDYFIVDPVNHFAQGDSLVHIEAIGSVNTAAPVADAGFWSPLDYTFYGRYLSFTASDNREPLATVWATRYFAGTVGAFTDDSDIICWRDAGVNDSQYFTCGREPFESNLGAPGRDFYPLSQNQIVIFDEQENPVVPEGSPFSPPPIGDEFTPCPCASTRANASDFGSIFDFGWLYLNLNTDVADSVINPTKQSHVTALHNASGEFSVGYEAIHFDSALDKTFTVTTAPADVILGP